jgi:hypothetical protein
MNWWYIAAFAAGAFAWHWLGHRLLRLALGREKLLRDSLKKMPHDSVVRLANGAQKELKRRDQMTRSAQ